MSRGQRFTFLAIAALIAVVAVFVLADSSEDDTPPEGEQSAATATPTPTESAPEASPQEEETPTPTPEPTPEPPPLLTSGGVTEIEVDKGDTVRFRVRSSTPEEIHVHGYEITREIPPNKTVNVSFPAELDGIWEIEFHNSGKQIAELKVNP